MGVIWRTGSCPCEGLLPVFIRGDRHLKICSTACFMAGEPGAEHGCGAGAFGAKSLALRVPDYGVHMRN